MGKTIEILREDDPVRVQVEDYVYKNYKSLNGKPRGDDRYIITLRADIPAPVR